MCSDRKPPPDERNQPHPQIADCKAMGGCIVYPSAKL
jgi:hypothetical protein